MTVCNRCSKETGQPIKFLPTKSFLWIKIPVGWKDLGKVESGSYVKNGEVIRTTKIHKLCSSTLHMGKTDKSLFQFCPKCFVITNPTSL